MSVLIYKLLHPLRSSSMRLFADFMQQLYLSQEMVNISLEMGVYFTRMFTQYRIWELRFWQLCFIINGLDSYILLKSIVQLNSSKSINIKHSIFCFISIPGMAAVVQLVRAFAFEAQGWVFESQPWQTQVIKTGSDNFTAIRCECHGSSEMTIINEGPMSQYVRQAKEPLLLNGHEWRAKVKILSP